MDQKVKAAKEYQQQKTPRQWDYNFKCSVIAGSVVFLFPNYTYVWKHISGLNFEFIWSKCWNRNERTFALVTVSYSHVPVRLMLDRAWCPNDLKWLHLSQCTSLTNLRSGGFQYRTTLGTLSLQPVIPVIEQKDMNHPLH